MFTVVETSPLQKQWPVYWMEAERSEFASPKPAPRCR